MNQSGRRDEIMMIRVMEATSERNGPVFGRLEAASGPSLALRHSPLLLFLHSLAVKPSFVHLSLETCWITPYVMDHMPVWPHLQCLCVFNDSDVDSYSFVDSAARFPSLTSLASPSCHDAAIEQLVQLPRLEELRFLNYTVTSDEHMRSNDRARLPRL